MNLFQTLKSRLFPAREKPPERAIEGPRLDALEEAILAHFVEHPEEWRIAGPEVHQVSCISKAILIHLRNTPMYGGENPIATSGKMRFSDAFATQMYTLAHSRLQSEAEAKREREAAEERRRLGLEFELR